MHAHVAHSRRRYQLTALFSWPALFMFAALLLGGGTRAGLSSDFLLQLLALPLLWQFVRTFPQGADWLVQLLILGALLLFAWQLLPWWGRQGLFFPNTRDPYLTLQAFLVFLVPLAFFWRMLQHDAPAPSHMAAWFLLGIVANLLAYLLLVSAGQPHWQLFEWRMHAGFLANENHLALLLVVGVPVLMAWLKQAQLSWLIVPVLLVIAFMQLLIGSRAGVALFLLAAVLSWAFVHRQSLLLSAGIVSLAAFLTLTLWWWQGWQAFVWARDFLQEGQGISRAAIWRNTWQALVEFWPWGSGFGTFVPIYASHEPLTDISDRYVNRAHSDWLEVALEGGLAALLLIAGLLLAIVHRLWLVRPLDVWRRAALLALTFIAFHSLVDYPLRTLAVAVPTAWFLALLLAPPASRLLSSRPWPLQAGGAS